ncbi:MAG: ferritin [Deltaproteobacteria bacterium]|nr:ferritin [Deltaproteobacteria bacterium]
MGSETWHEALEKLTPATQELHRALMSVVEEFEAVDWYQQRIDATPDPELQAILAHNRDEEKEHASMILEWIRRHDPAFGRAMATYLFTEGDVTAIEEAVEGKGEAPNVGERAEGARADEPVPSPVAPAPRAFTVGSLKGR